MRFTARAWSPKTGHKVFNLNAPDLRTALNVARARVPTGEVSVSPARRGKA